MNPLGVPSTAEAAEAMFSLVNYLSRVDNEVLMY